MAGKRSWKSLVCHSILHFYTWRSVELSKEWQLLNGQEKVVEIPSLSHYYILPHIKKCQIISNCRHLGFLHMEKCGIIWKCRNRGFHGQYWTFMVSWALKCSFCLFKVHFSLSKGVNVYKYYNYCLACLKQQRSLAFSSCKSVGNFSPGVSWALKCSFFLLKIIFDLLITKEVNV